MKTKLFPSYPRKNAGYTFMELIVVISIFGIMSSVALLNFSDYTTQASLQNTAEDIALTIKQAQSASIAGKTYGDQDPTFTPSYGLYFDVDKPDQFIYFYNNIDGGSEGYDGNAEKIREIKITTSDMIDKLCVTDANNGNSLDCGVTKMSVAFKRPFPDTIITGSLNSGVVPNEAIIRLVSIKGKQMAISVSALGSIAVSPLTSP